MPRTSVLVCIAALVGGTSAHAAVVVTRPVHIQAVTPDSVTILWHTRDSTTALVEFGTTLAYGRSAESKRRARRHAITLHRLAPGTVYYYRVTCQESLLASGPDFRVRTLPDKRTSRFRFLAFGDSGKGSAAQYSLVPEMLRAAPDFVVHTGDVIYPLGEAADFDPKYFLPYKDIVRNTPVWLSLGNHDYGTGNGQPYLDAFLLPRDSPARDERYYSFTFGQAHFAVLDSNGLIDSTAIQWLDRNLASATTLWKFAVFHHPPYSCGMHGSSTYVRNRFAPIFERHGVDIVLTGHDHDYQRSHPMLAGAIIDSEQGPGYRNPRGVVYVVTGGGAGPRATSSACAFTATAVAATHFTQVDIDGPMLTLQAIDAAGRVLDRITIDKSPGSAGSDSSAARLLANVPNPFNPATRLRYEIERGAFVRLGIYDLAGRLVRELVASQQARGRHQSTWDGRNAQDRDVASGVYLVRLQTGAAVTTRKIILAR